MKRVLFVAAVTFVWLKHDRLQHLALPVLTKPEELPAAEPVALAEAPAVELQPVAQLGTRITALLTASDGALWAGTFDRGVYRSEVPLTGNGRQQFVNALVEHRGSVWAATYSGVLEYALDGTLRGVRLPGISAEALVVHRGQLVAGTVRGLYRDFVLAGPESQRINALTVNGETLWLGTPSGVYEEGGTWHPLVFGPEASSTNVVLALAPYGRGVLALTDNGGVVDVQPGRTVRAHRFIEARANEGNPGALLATSDTVFIGTQGGGLLELVDGRIARPKGWATPIVSALAPGLIGDGAGNVWRVAKTSS